MRFTCVLLMGGVLLGATVAGAVRRGVNDVSALAYDLVIRNARIVDGTGTPWYRGDIAVRGDAIVAMASSIDPAGARTIDAAGKVAAPGFIDIHTHARRGIFEVPTADNSTAPSA